MTTIRLFAFLCLAGSLALHAPSTRAASFRPNVTVDGETVTLGDLFDDAGAASSQPVARAPAPGQHMVFDAHALASLAQAYGLDWRSANPHDRAIIMRSAIVVGGDKIESLVEAALSDKGVARPFAVVFDQQANQRLLPTGAGALSIASMDYDGDSRRFSGTLAASGPSGPIAIPVSGRATAVIQVPVLNRVVHDDEIVGAADIEMAAMREDQMARDTLLQASAIVGHTAGHALQPNRALRIHDFKRDLVIKNGQTVTLVLDDPEISLTTKGRALNDGAKGDPVKVLNVSSNRVVEGFATGLNLVSVSDDIQPVHGADGVSVQ